MVESEAKFLDAGRTPVPAVRSQYKDMEGPQPLALRRSRHAWAEIVNRNVACLADLWPSLEFLVCHDRLGEDRRVTYAMVRCLRELLFLEAEFGRIKKELTRSANGDFGEGSHDDRLSKSFFCIHPRVPATAVYGGTEEPQPPLESAEADFNSSWSSSSIMQTAIGCSRLPLVGGPLVGPPFLRTTTVTANFCGDGERHSALSVAFRALLLAVACIRRLPLSQDTT